MGFKRARSNEQIQDRIQEIVNAASTIYNAVGYEGLSFTTISEHTNFTRPNIYKYFKTKDEILLIIIKDDFKSFVTSLMKSFKINRLYTLYEISEIWTDKLMEHRRILDMYALLSLIEKNVSVEALSEFKKEMTTLQLSLINLISELFPKAGKDSVENFFYLQLTLAFGLYPTCQLNDLQIKALKLAGLNYTYPDFKKTYSAGLYQLMYCLEQSIDIKKNRLFQKSKK